MNLLVFSDLHCDVAAARRLTAHASEVDVLVGAGDFASVRQNLSACLDVLRASGRPMVFVAGNNETTDELRKACEGWPDTHVLHGSGVTIGAVPFFGLGGGVPVTPFGSWSYDLTEPEAEGLLKPCPTGAVLVSHSPPFGYCDKSSRGDSLGSRAVLNAIKQYQPQLVVCGHIHGSAGSIAKVNDTTIINAGPSGRVIEVSPSCNGVL